MKRPRDGWKKYRARHGACLEHGHAHEADHARWSRRDFLSSMGLAVAGGSMVLSGTPVRAFGRTSLLSHLASLETDRILILIQLSGGNDGLNTVVPITNSAYYNARPQIAIPAGATQAIDGQVDVALHPAMTEMAGLYNDGRLALLQNVGYPDPVLSHFDATDVWLTASHAENGEPGDFGSTGWVGRYLGQEYPDFDTQPTDYPLAVQMGGTSALLFQGGITNMGMSLSSPELFERIATEGILYTLDGVPETTYGDEIKFVRTVANDSFYYADAIQSASELGVNDVEYPGANQLANNLAVVARLIKGGLGSRIYHVSIGSFDTHANQGAGNGQHAALLRNLSQAVSAFLEDVDAGGRSDDLLIATFSEFGRRVQQNGSAGTDHGTAAPMFLLGKGVEGGLLGGLPDLDDLDQTGNLKFAIDFRSVYATVLRDWFGLAADSVAAIMGGDFEALPVVSDPATPTSSGAEAPPTSFVLHQNYPNPFSGTTTISYNLDQTGHVTLQVFDSTGRQVETLVDWIQSVGRHEIRFGAKRLAGGRYFYRLETPTASLTREMVLAN